MTRTAALLLGLALLLPPALSAQTAPQNLDSLIDRRGVYLHPQTLEPYSGPVVAFWIADRVRERGTLRNGRWNGERTSYFPDGQLEVRETYRDGVLDGPFESFFRTGRPSDRGTYRNNVLDGMYEAFWSRQQADIHSAHVAGTVPADQLPQEGDLMEQGLWVGGKPCGEWYRFIPTGPEGKREPFFVDYPPCK